jgi:hypothetical protein
MKLKIVNSTKIDSETFHELIEACVKQEGMEHEKILCEIVYRNASYGMAGQGWYGLISDKRFRSFGFHRAIRLRLPRFRFAADSGQTGFDLQKEIDYLNEEKEKPWIAHVILHELAHTRGVHHKEMGDKFLQAKFDLAPFVFTKIETKRATPIDKIQLKKTHAEAMLKRHLSSLKREQNLVKKWTTRLKRYSKTQDNNQT